MDADSKDILESLDFIKEHMLMKDEALSRDDVRKIVREEIKTLVPDMIHKAIESTVPGIIRAELKPIWAELKEIRADIADLKATYENIAGYAKEIDPALEWIGRLEEHLGLRPLAA